MTNTPVVEGESIHKEENLEISYDTSTEILFCRWKGFQNKEKIMKSGNTILDVFKKKTNCSKIFNDNTEVTGPWQDAAEWTATEWFPAMEKAGLKHFAWVFSPNIFAELSAQKAQPNSDIVRTFKSREEAHEWLKSQ